MAVKALVAAGATLHPVRPDERGEELERGGMPRPGMRGTHVTLSLREAWNELWALGARRLLVEAGPELISALLKQGFIDQLCIYTGAINGGRGSSLAGVFQTVRLFGRMDRECGPDAVLEASYTTTATGYQQQSVIVQLISSHRLQVHRNLSHFGLSPAQRGRVQPSNYVQPGLPGIDEAPRQQSGFAQFAVVR